MPWMIPWGEPLRQLADRLLQQRPGRVAVFALPFRIEPGGAQFVAERPDIRLVIETHSEYLLTRLRLRVAQGTLSPAEISVLFAWQTRQLNGNHGPAYSDYRELSVDELGNFDIWPDDFFDSLDLESVELAKAVTKRVHERHSAPDK